MSATLILLGYAAVLAVAGPRVLTRGGWTQRAPKLAIITWQAVTVTTVASVVLAGLALAVPTVRVSTDLAELLRACIFALRTQYATPGGATAAGFGGGVALAVAARALWCLGAALVAGIRARAGHRDTLALLGTRFLHLDAAVVVLAHDDPAVYCLPGRNRRIVVTSGALRVLDDDQLGAALAHERAHLAQRHDLVLACSAGLAAAFPRLRLFTTAHAETLRLVELLADDVAARTATRLTLAEALLNLTRARTPTGGLGAGGSTAAIRVRRLIGPHAPLGRGPTACAAAALAALMILPVLALAAPAVAAGHRHYCPPGVTAPTTLQVLVRN